MDKLNSLESNLTTGYRGTIQWRINIDKSTL